MKKLMRQTNNRTEVSHQSGIWAYRIVKTILVVTKVLLNGTLRSSDPIPVFKVSQRIIFWTVRDGDSIPSFNGVLFDCFKENKVDFWFAPYTSSLVDFIWSTTGIYFLFAKTLFLHDRELYSEYVVIIIIMLKSDNGIIVSIVLAYPFNVMRYLGFKQKYSNTCLIMHAQPHSP